MKIETQMATMEGKPGEQEEALLAKWDIKNEPRKRIAWKAKVIESIVHLLIEHASPKDYIKINKAKDKKNRGEASRNIIARIRERVQK